MMTAVITVILGLQQPSGVFAGDAFGETDTRFLYYAVSALSLLGALDRLDRERTVSYLVLCRNFDGGFGRIAGSESHAAQGMSLSPSRSLYTICASCASFEETS
jgi:geranylgeranyl transferase type-2 subunit beta